MRPAALAVLCALGGVAADAPLHVPFEKYKLANGLRVVLARDAAIPVVAVYTVYEVGSRTEETGRAGYAHLFEHLMYEGSAQISSNGGESGGVVSGGGAHLDYTDSYEALPSNRLPFALWVESGRMRGTGLTEENLKARKEAVERERRREFSQPYRGAIANWPGFVFGNFQNAHPLFGPAAGDAAGATLEDARKFFRAYYAPNNALLVVSGDFDPAEAKKLIAGYFGDIASQPQPKRPGTAEAPRAESRSQTVKDANARFPAVIAGWPAPPRHSGDWYAIEMIDAVLTSGEGARLKVNMAQVRQSLLQADANLGWPAGTAVDFKEPGDYAGMIVYNPRFSAAEVLDQYQREIDSIAREGVGGTELGRVKAVVRFAMASAMQTALGRAKLLGIHELLDGDAGYTEKDFANLMAVTSDQMQAAAKKYLTRSRRDVMAIEPAGVKQ